MWDGKSSKYANKEVCTSGMLRASELKIAETDPQV